MRAALAWVPGCVGACAPWCPLGERPRGTRARRVRVALALCSGGADYGNRCLSAGFRAWKANALLGRISAVNFIFIGASNELGGFESALVAQLFGPVISVVGGGIGTILVVMAVALIWPEMRRLGTMSAGK